MVQHAGGKAAQIVLAHGGAAGWCAGRLSRGFMRTPAGMLPCFSGPIDSCGMHFHSTCRPPVPEYGLTSIEEALFVAGECGAS